MFLLLSVCILVPKTRPILVLLSVFRIMNFMEFILDFHGRVGPRRICRLNTDIFLVVYMYGYVYIYSCGYATNSVLQVADVCCSVFVLFLFRVGF